mmetsp:Transcript_17986/g.63176  ORF Transcript_17986/g.63176 Transcript_17986/m.63176 type:complete len:263 (+) Transcript_17986:182-970(+)
MRMPSAARMPPMFPAGVTMLGAGGAVSIFTAVQMSEERCCAYAALLLNFGADAERVDAEGLTCADHAAKNGRFELAHLLANFARASADALRSLCGAAAARGSAEVAATGCDRAHLRHARAGATRGLAAVGDPDVPLTAQSCGKLISLQRWRCARACAEDGLGGVGSRDAPMVPILTGNTIKQRVLGTIGHCLYWLRWTVWNHIALQRLRCARACAEVGVGGDGSRNHPLAAQEWCKSISLQRLQHARCAHVGCGGIGSCDAP